MLKPKASASALERPDAFRRALVDWFDAEGRDYPWRRTRDPYAILVSEVMLQQTQIATVLGRGFYTRFLATFPDIAALAQADDERLLKAWEGLGYYRRARMLRETARAVIAEHGGRFPDDLIRLKALPGIGPYTAGALRSFAFDLPAALVDGNVARVMARLMDFSEPIDDGAGLRQLWEWAENLADPDHPRSYNSALMELGQRLCRPGVPDCLVCPVASWCLTRHPQRLPIKRKKALITEVDEHAFWCEKNGRVLMHCEQGNRRQGLWKLPTRAVEEIGHLPVIDTHRYTITRYRVTLRVHAACRAEILPAEGESWMPEDRIRELAMPSPFRKVIERMLESRGLGCDE